MIIRLWLGRSDTMVAALAQYPRAVRAPAARPVRGRLTSDRAPAMRPAPGRERRSHPGAGFNAIVEEERVVTPQPVRLLPRAVGAMESIVHHVFASSLSHAVAHATAAKSKGERSAGTFLLSVGASLPPVCCTAVGHNPSKDARSRGCAARGSSAARAAACGSERLEGSNKGTGHTGAALRTRVSGRQLKNGMKRW